MVALKEYSTVFEAANPVVLFSTPAPVAEVSSNTAKFVVENAKTEPLYHVPLLFTNILALTLIVIIRG